MPYYTGTPAEPAETGDGQRECARGQWCADRTVTIEDGQRVTRPASGYRAFCDRDAATITNCVGDFPGIYLRLEGELHRPVQAETQVHSPFGPSVPVRLDADEAMRLIASTLAMWEARVRAQAPAHLLPRDPRAPVHTARAVKTAAALLAAHPATLLGLEPGWTFTHHPVPPGRAARLPRGPEGVCEGCGHLISRSPASGRWWAAEAPAATWAGPPGPPPLAACEHTPAPGTIVLPPRSVHAAVLDEYGWDTEIVRAGADFLTVLTQRSGADAGLDFLHLHYWSRAVLRETLERPEELVGVECRSCSLLALRRAEPPWYPGDPENYSECAGCGDLMSGDDYRKWVTRLADYHRARLAARPVLATPSQ